METPLFDAVLRLADDALILGHRLSEWCGHAPLLEEDLALANIALDLVGEARSLYTLAGEIEGKGRDEDALAYRREERGYRNLLIAELPNGDFARTIVRQLLVSAVMAPYWTRAAASTDPRVAAIAAKAEKEVAYHLRHASEWVVRLGDGTEESRRRTEAALAELWPWTGELFETDAGERALAEAGVLPDRGALKAEWLATVDAVLDEATLARPADGYMQSGGRRGVHTEHMGYLLAELQYLQRAYPNATW